MIRPQRDDGESDRSVPFAQNDSVVALFDAEFDAMLRLAYVLTRSQQEAEDVVQDAFVAVTDRWSSILNPGGYLRAAVVNGARRRGLRDANRDRILRRYARSIAANAEQTDVHEHIIDLLDTLPDNHRLAVVLAYYLDMGPTEIADTLGCRPGTAKSWVHRGLRRLRKELEHE